MGVDCLHVARFFSEADVLIIGDLRARGQLSSFGDESFWSFGVPCSRGQKSV